ncbi:hypothetical protein IFM89_013665 [Coptis chinensis]|uniref:Cytochrome P450 n=1 Tax=Coptis chinensis TaxID=261450 RepID=A0A835INU5_9MAGN|nr:hypothetical protein IFM89_013665 [Coptis chinensis]
MAFGGGMRLCAGAEFAKLQMSVVLHSLVTKYRWTKIRGGEVVKTPGIVFPNGLHIKVTKTIWRQRMIYFAPFILHKKVISSTGLHGICQRVLAKAAFD